MYFIYSPSASIELNLLGQIIQKYKGQNINLLNKVSFEEGNFQIDFKKSTRGSLRKIFNLELNNLIGIKIPIKIDFVNGLVYDNLNNNLFAKLKVDNYEIINNNLMISGLLNITNVIGLFAHIEDKIDIYFVIDISKIVKAKKTKSLISYLNNIEIFKMIQS